MSGITRREATFGPPGTGKTTEFTRRLATVLASGVSGSEICAATFTKAATLVFRERIKAQTGLTDDDMPFMRTLHSLCWRLIGMEKARLASRHLAAFTAAYPQYEMSEREDHVNPEYLEAPDEQDEATAGDHLLNIWNYIRNRGRRTVADACRTGDYPPVDVSPEEVRQFVDCYETWKARNRYLDFTDLLLHVLDHEVILPCTHFLLDEAQDLTPLQWAVWDLWTEDAALAALFGDDDQLLYEFLGARPRGFLSRARQTTPTVLSHSYRCPSRLTRLARSLIELNRERHPKEYEAAREGGDFRVVRDWEEALAEPQSDAFFLTRHRYQLTDSAIWLMRQGRPFVNRRGESPLTQPGAKAARAAAALAAGEPIIYQDWLHLLAVLSVVC